MSERGVTAAALPIGESGALTALPAGDVPGGGVSGRWAAGRGVAPGRAERWQAWRARFGLAEVCGTIAAVSGFTAGYLIAGSLLAAAGLATLCEALGFYGCVGVKTTAAACRATAHLDGLRRLAAGAWHVITEQLASCAVAEALDGLLVRPGCLAGAAWLARPLPGGVWLGFAVGKVAADVAWYGMEASARRGVAWTVPGGQPATPYVLLDLARAQDSFAELAAALPGVAVHYAAALQVGADRGAGQLRLGQVSAEGHASRAGEPEENDLDRAPAPPPAGAAQPPAGPGPSKLWIPGR